MQIHDSLPDDVIPLGKPATGAKSLSDLKYGVFFLPENIGKVLEVTISEDKRKKVDFFANEKSFRTYLSGYVRPKGFVGSTHPELCKYQVTVRKSATKPDTFYVQVTLKEAN